MGKILGFTTITKKGQITIPLKVREYLKVQTGDRILILLDENKVIIDSGEKDIKT